VNREQGAVKSEECSQANELGYVVKSEQGAGSDLTKDCCLPFNYPIRNSGKYIKRGFNTPYNQKAKF